MKKEVMEKWVAALRSGKYAQTQRSLRDESGFCCLGVLCDIKDAAKWSEPKAFGSGRASRVYNGSSDCLPTSVVDWAGMKNHTGEFYRSSPCLAEYNDEGYSFAKIADIIEQNWEEL